MNKHDFPKIHFYDQDFVDIYNKTWTMLSDYWINPKTEEKTADGYFIYPSDGKLIIDQFESILSSFFLVYSNRNYDANLNIDYSTNVRKKMVQSDGVMMQKQMNL